MVFYRGKKNVIIILALLCGCLYLCHFISKDNNIDSSNKSLERNIEYESDISTGSNVFHLSFDDVIACLEDISINEYKSIFDNSFFAWLKSLHNQYGCVISLYVYYENDDFSLTQCTDNYLDEFRENGDWLRFGFHARNGAMSYNENAIYYDYIKTICELERIVGSEQIDNVIRIHGFEGKKEEIADLVKADQQPIIGLLTADDNRLSYYLDERRNSFIYCHDELEDEELGLKFASTDMRIEYISSIEDKIEELQTDSWNNQLGDLVIFSHEWAINTKTKYKIEKLCDYARNNGYNMLFFEDAWK